MSRILRRPMFRGGGGQIGGGIIYGIPGADGRYGFKQPMMYNSLEEILKISRETVKKPHKLIILKGKNAQSEINNVSLGSNYSYKLEKSITDHDSKIIIVDVK